MEIFEYNSRLIEVIETSDASVDGMVYECSDITTPDGRGLLFTLAEDSGRLWLRLYQEKVDLALLKHVIDQLGLNTE